MRCDKKLVSSFVIIKCWNEPSYHHILIPQCIHVGCFAWNGSILNTGLPIQYYSKGLPGPRYPKSNCRFCHNYSSYSFHIHNIMSILNVLSIFVNKRKFVRKNADRGRTTEHISSYCFKFAFIKGVFRDPLGGALTLHQTCWDFYTNGTPSVHNDHVPKDSCKLFPFPEILANLFDF